MLVCLYQKIICNFGEWELAWTVVSNELYSPPYFLLFTLIALLFVALVCYIIIIASESCLKCVAVFTYKTLKGNTYATMWSLFSYFSYFFFLVFHPLVILTCIVVSVFMFYFEISISHILQLVVIPYFVLLCCFSHNQLWSPRSSCLHTLVFPLWYYWFLCDWLFGLFVDFAFCLYLSGFFALLPDSLGLFYD